MDRAGFVTNKTPTTAVIIPKAKDHPQLCNWSLLAIAKMISDIPPNRNDRLNKMARASEDVAGDVKVMMLTIIKNIPTNRGMYQCFNALLIRLKNRFSINCSIC